MINTWFVHAILPHFLFLMISPDSSSCLQISQCYIKLFWIALWLSMCDGFITSSKLQCWFGMKSIWEIYALCMGYSCLLYKHIGGICDKSRTLTKALFVIFWCNSLNDEYISIDSTTCNHITSLNSQRESVDSSFIMTTQPE